MDPHPKRRKTDPKEPISFGRAYAQSNTFRMLFQEGMALVEETADYLDGDGRQAARELPRPASIVYATESMRLTTRLMQLASWLLLHRSVREGDMTAERAREEKKKIRLEKLSTNIDRARLGRASEGFSRADHAFAQPAKARRAHRRGALRGGNPPETENNPVNAQLRELAAALRGKV